MNQHSEAAGNRTLDADVENTNLSDKLVPPAHGLGAVAQWPVVIVGFAWIGRLLYFFGDWIMLRRSEGRIKRAGHALLLVALIVMCLVGAH